MQRYIRSTIVEPLLRLRRERILLAGGDVVVRNGQEVSPMQVVARRPQEMNFQILPICDLLRISPEELRERLLVEEGMSVDQGTPLVAKRGWFGRPFISPMDGTVYRIRDGRIVLQRTVGWTELRAILPGRVVRQIPNRGVVIEANGSLIQGVWSSGKNGFGRLKMVAQSADQPFSPHQLNDETQDHVLVVGVVNQLDALRKAAQNRTQGLIGASMSAELSQMARSLAFPVLLTDGFGSQPMAEPIFKMLQESDSREVTLFGGDQASEYRRPEIIILQSAIPTVDSDRTPEPIRVGQSVRILRPPYSSQVAEVVRLYARAQMTLVGTKAHGADVELTDGRIVFVPYANLDAMK
jgi:hypothetical protein